MGEDDAIERCAGLADAMVGELEALKKTASRGRYDRQTARRIDYAIRAITRLAERISALKGVSAPEGE